jgi:hypothetical protein
MASECAELTQTRHEGNLALSSSVDKAIVFILVSFIQVTGGRLGETTPINGTRSNLEFPATPPSRLLEENGVMPKLNVRRNVDEP